MKITKGMFMKGRKYPEGGRKKVIKVDDITSILHAIQQSHLPDALKEEAYYLIESALPRKEIKSHLKIALAHLLKMEVYNRGSNSWTSSVKNAINEINEHNERGKSKGYYYSKAELHQFAEEVYLKAKKLVVQESNGNYTLHDLKPYVFQVIWNKLSRKLRSLK